MNDKDLRALAAKLLKHYVVEDETVAKIVEAKPLERGEPKVIPMITAEERALLNMLGGPMAAAMEGRVISLAAQGCACGCSCGCGDGDDGGGEASAGEASAGESSAGEASAGSAGAAGGFGDGSVGGETGSFGAAADAGADAASAAASGLAGDLGAAADAAAAATGATGDLGSAVGLGNNAASDLANAPGETNGLGLSAGQAAGWGGLGAGLGSQGAEGLAGLADGPDGPDTGMVGLTNDSLTAMSPEELNALMSAPQADRGISAATYSSLADQNAALSNTLDAVSTGLDANAAAQGSSGTLGSLGSLGSTLGELFGISSAQAAQNAPSYGYMVSPYAAQGQLADPNAVALSNALTDRAAMPPSSTEDKYGFNAFDPTSIANQNVTFSGAYGNQNVMGSPAMSGSPTAGAPGLATASAPVGSTTTAPSDEDLSDLTTTYVQTTPITPPAPEPAAPAMTTSSVPASWAAGTPGAFSPTLTGQFTTAGIVGGPMALDPYAGMTPIGPATAPSSPVAEAPSVPDVSTGPLTVQGPSYTGIPAIDSRIDNAINNPGTTALNIAVGMVPGLGLLNTASGLLGGPTVGSLLAGSKGAEPGTTPDLFGDGGSEGVVPPLVTTVTPTTGSGSSLPAAVSPVATQEAILRRYLGAGSNLYRYGMGPERTYYSARGGYFDADQYFADGGLVSPMQPPSQPTVPPYPTMAFTDGGGPVGSIAQPPGLASSDAVGSDAPHASPMAPSIAASVPTMQPGLATLSMRNVNASPAPSPISQNPNVGYALGQSPLSNL